MQGKQEGGGPQGSGLQASLPFLLWATRDGSAENILGEMPAWHPAHLGRGAVLGEYAADHGGRDAGASGRGGVLVPDLVPRLGDLRLGDLSLFSLPFPLRAELQQVAEGGQSLGLPPSLNCCGPVAYYFPQGQAPPPSHLQAPPPPCPGFLSHNRLWIDTTEATRSGDGVDMYVRNPQFCLSALTLDSWNLGE